VHGKACRDPNFLGGLYAYAEFCNECSLSNLTKLLVATSLSIVLLFLFPFIPFLLLLSRLAPLLVFLALLFNPAVPHL